MNEFGVMRGDGFVVLSGPALKTARDSALIAAQTSPAAGRSPQPYKALASELIEAMSAKGHSDVRKSAICDPVPMQPTVPIAEAAVRLGVSLRQARRLAPRIGGRKIAGSWFVNETALREHIEGAK